MRAAVVDDPRATPVCAEFPDPEHGPDRPPLRLVGAGLHHVARFGDGTFDAPYTVYPLSRIGEAWAHQGHSRAVIVPD